MFTTLDKRSKIWAGGGKILSRRLVSQLFCRFPLLVLWTIVVILLLYKSLNSDKIYTNNNNEDSNTFKALPSQSVQNSYYFHEENKFSNTESDSSYTTQEIVRHSDTEDSSSQRLDSQPVLSTTTKSTLEYARQSRVFILIVHDEKYSNAKPNQPFRRGLYESSTLSSRLEKESRNKIIIPAHVKTLISILNAHRIKYDIDTTQTGLPTSLLTDQNNSSETKRYSVIVIDDFLKYTKLNRWIRDQLDRHCRLNQIGVITYFTSDEPLPALKFHNNNINRSSRSIKSILLKKEEQATTEASLTNQFPILFKPILKSKLCKNQTSTACFSDLQLNELSPILRILKRRADFIINEPFIDDFNQLPLISMSSSHISYQPLTWIKFRSDAVSSTQRLTKELDYSVLNNSRLDRFSDELLLNEINAPDVVNLNSTSDYRLALSLYDRGLYDGVKRVIFGESNQHWLNRILLLDSIEHLSSGQIFTPLERYIQIDIDDIFVGEKGKRMKQEDVEELIITQEKFRRQIKGEFKFNLGYSGKYFNRGEDDENEGDEELIKRASEFTWFCHTWAHTKAHLINDTLTIADELMKNLRFACKHKLPIIGYNSSYCSEERPRPATYAIAPHHSGVYPVHEQLYEAWRDVLNVQVTSTEEYPSLRPADGRRAFVHKTIKVLPRQTCGLYTHTIYRNKYPGGIEKLEASIRGGELFETILHNPVNIYMTHMSNYANDRLAPYTFLSLLQFIQTNTNLILKYAPSSSNQLGPAWLADYYFKLYPEEKQVLWSNPCNDKRHLNIWAPKKHRYCSKVPKLLIVGPQKTGTTALYTYLKMNNLFKSSKISSADYEENQFFNDKHYSQGVDWYFNKFSTIDGDSEANSTLTEESFYFDKSATYFDDPKVPLRASHLVPEARIIILLINPTDRAYSWYQHIKAHGDPIANLMSFEQIIMSKDEDSPKGLSIKALRQRCLHPGYYAQHLVRWLEYYPSKQIIIIDGQWFRHNPASVMNRLQLILRISQPINYDDLLVYSKEKGFFCERDESSSSKVKCLGGSKGRKYPPMSSEARLFLNKHYWPHNRLLARILSEIGQPLPIWLDETMNIIHAG